MMDTEIVTSTNEFALTEQKFEYSPVGLVVSGDPTYEEWELVGQQLGYIDGAVHWWIGDWLNYGEQHWGEMYTQAMDETGFEYQTCADDKWVASKVNFSSRNENLTFKHHRVIAPLEPEQQKEWLDRAEEEGWSAQELRQHLKNRESKPQQLVTPAEKSPRLIVAHAENMPQVASESIDLIITSPPYNLGGDEWPMGGGGRVPRETGIGYQDQMLEGEYQAWQGECLKEMYRVANPGASLFYNHKVRNQKGQIIHPMDWLRNIDNPWILRQEIVWDRRSTHNHSATIFWPEDERIYWMTKGKPTLPDRPIGMSTIWEFHGPVVDTWHPAPFCDELPKRCIEAVGREGIVVLDPFAGSCTTLKVALDYGYDAIGVDVSVEYLEKAKEENGWLEG